MLLVINGRVTVRPWAVLDSPRTSGKDFTRPFTCVRPLLGHSYRPGAYRRRPDRRTKKETTRFRGRPDRPRGVEGRVDDRSLGYGETSGSSEHRRWLLSTEVGTDE